MNYLIIGGNAAGMSFASKLRRNDLEAKITVLEAKDYVSYGACGLPYFVADDFADPDIMIARTVEQFAQNNIEVLINHLAIEINFESKKVVATNGSSTLEFPYDKLIIATGAKPIVPNFSLQNKNHFHTLTTIEDGVSLKENINRDYIQNIAILGAGYIGMELVDSLLQMGKNIYLYEANNHILATQFSQTISGIAEDSLHGITNLKLHLNERIEDITDNEDKDKYYVVTAKGKTEVDLVVSALGFHPNTDFINLDKLKNGAIVVDEFYETSQKDVYAIGDCATAFNKQLQKGVYTPLATIANKNGRQLAEYILGEREKFSGFLGSSMLLVNGYEMATTGLNERQLKENNITYASKIIKDANQTAYYPGREEITAHVFYDPQTFKLLGAQLIGKKGAALRIHPLTIAIDQGMTTKELAYVDFGYAPPFTKTWDFLNIIGSVIK